MLHNQYEQIIKKRDLATFKIVTIKFLDFDAAHFKTLIIFITKVFFVDL